MKSLYIVRHAEASSSNSNLLDFERPLNERGESEASSMGTRLRLWLKPDILISSPALRAKTTANILAGVIDYPRLSIVFDERIYEAELEDLLSVVRGLDNAASCALLIGHNPALTRFVNALSTCDVRNMPTCSIVVLRIPLDSWADIDGSSAELQDFDYPGKAAE